ncbi:AAA family ATPase [Plantibacter flavus]|uniref:ATP-binding protein n=1 Tax=Plantibacter flavus TaxID=150123 RepID=UPI0010C1F8DA|nr:ATP-binding protein [Plantibacter sp. CFBP 8804]TKJ98768.1 AAA family ATPase [Plantibacter flavus]
MWRLEKRRDDGDVTSGVEREAAEAQLREGPVAASAGVVDTALHAWRQQLSTVGGPSPLLHFVDAPTTRVELSSTHPGGLPQFISGKSTLLSNLIRDEIALRGAKRAADRITTKGIELSTVRGIDAVHLAVGLAQWTHQGEDFSAPVLLRPLAIRRYGRDYEVKLRGATTANPELVRALREQFGIVLDPDEFVALSESGGVFKPQPVIDRLRSLAAGLEWFTVQPRLLVSSFAAVGHSLLDDAAKLDHPILDAVAGDEGAVGLVRSSFTPVDAPGQDDRPPSTDTLLLDADVEQENVIAQIGAGNSLVVTTLPGTGGTQTIVNAIGVLASQHKRVLVVSPRRSTLEGIRHRLTKVGLPGLCASPSTLRRDLIQAITRNERAIPPQVGEVDDALVRLRRVLIDYRTSLQAKDPDLRVSVIDALEALSKLSKLPHPPGTLVRLDRQTLVGLAAGRSRAAEALEGAAALGEFRYGPGDSPWYGASFDTTAEAQETHDLAKRLHRKDLPQLLERAYGLIGQTQMRPFESIDELGIYLRLLADIRETLDRFQPDVFDRSLADLIVATSPRKDSAAMSSASRRRLKALAKEYLRPGAHVPDMNAALRRIQQQRTLWQRYVTTGAPPEVPLGIADVEQAYQTVAAKLELVDQPLGIADTPDRLGRLAIPSLVRTISELAAESEVLHNLQERTAILAGLREQGLGELIIDLSQRHVPRTRLADELELAWWQSMLELVLTEDRGLLGANTSVVERLESDFRLVDEAHASASGQLLASLLADTWKIGLVDHATEGMALRSLLKRDRPLRAAELEQAAPTLSRVLAPVWLVSPYEVPRIPESASFDAVFLVDAGATLLAENVDAIRRARQVVAFGDPVTQSPSPFEIRLTDQEATPEQHADIAELHRESALEQLSSVLPTLMLTRSYRAGGEDLAELVNERFYGGQIDSLPWAGSFLGHGSLSLDYVPGGLGMPDPVTGAVESVDVEVERVVELVLEHASNRPKESLMVVTASDKHAVRVQQAVLAAFSRRADLSDFLLRERAEPFTVLTLEQSVAESRDRVIFSIGYGLTPHGRVLSDFGALGQPGGDRLLAVGMTRARRSMVIVSCVRPEDLDQNRIQHGILALARILTDTSRRASEDQATHEAEPMLVDLATRLETLGMRVDMGYRGKLALVASWGGRAVVVECDEELGDASLRESLRLRPDVLRRLGWHYVRVHSFDLFADAEAVAQRVAGVLGLNTTEHLDTAPIAVQVPRH